MRTREVVVAGAGLSGLAAGALLARKGARVVVLEEEQEPGGRLRQVSREGVMLDGGFHCFHYGERGPLAELSRTLELGLNFLEDPHGPILVAGKRKILLSPDSPDGGLEYSDLSKDEQEAVRGWLHALGSADPGKLHKKTAADFLEETGFAGSELVSALCAAQCALLFGWSPSETSAGVLARHVSVAGGSGLQVSAVEGGPGRVVKALVDKLLESGARLALGSKVQEVEIKGDRVTKVSTAGEEFIPDAFIYTGPPSALPGMVYGDLQKPGKLLRRCKSLKPAAAISVELWLKEKISEHKGLVAVPSEAVMGRFPGNLDPSLEPERGQLLSFLTVLPPEEVSQPKSAGAHIRRLKRVIKSVFPRAEECAGWERIRVIDLAAAGGPVPGKSRGPEAAPKEVKNLFFAGDGVDAEGILSGRAAGSALVAAEAAWRVLSEE